MANLLDLPNCVMIYLLSYLDATSLYLLHQTCERLSDLIASCRPLWREIDARRPPHTAAKLAFCARRMHADTAALLVRAPAGPGARLPPLARFARLAVLALENQTIAAKGVAELLPAGLLELSLRRTAVEHGASFFSHSAERLPRLRVLVLDECQWVTAGALMAVSKYARLEILSVCKCESIDNSIPYLSLAGQYGFRALKVLDVRLSRLGNTLIGSFYRSSSLLAVYYQNRDLTYKLDYFRRKLQLAEGGLPDAELGSEFGVAEKAGAGEAGSGNLSGLNDDAFADYCNRIVSERTAERLPASRLYVHPYAAECGCGAGGGREGEAPDAPGGDGGGLAGDYRRKVADIRRLLDGGGGSLGRGLAGSRSRQYETSIIYIPNANCASQIRQAIHEDNVDNQGNAPEDCRIFRLTIRRHNDQRLEPSTSRDEQRKRRLDPDELDEDVAKKTRKMDEAGPSGEQDQHPVEIIVPPPPPPPPPAWHQLRWPDLYVIQNSDSNFVRLHNLNHPFQKNNKVPLRYLSLRGYQSITDLTLYYIKDLDLDVLDLTYTSCTVKAINHYLVDHPSCRIVHENYCTCLLNLNF